MKLTNPFNGDVTLIGSTPSGYFKMTDCAKRVPSTDEYLDSSKDEDIFNKFIVKISVGKEKVEYYEAYYNGAEWKSLNGLPLYNVLSWAPISGTNNGCTINNIV